VRDDQPPRTPSQPPTTSQPTIRSFDTTAHPGNSRGGNQLQPSPPAAKRPSELRLAALTLLLPLYFAVAFSTNYIGALGAPSPHHVKIAIVGAPAATAALADDLSVKPKGAFTVSQLTSVAQASRLVGGRQLAGAYVPGSSRPTAIVATAASSSLSNFVQATFRRVAAGQDQPLAVDDVRPLPADDSGTPNFFFIVVCTLAGFLTITALGITAPTLPEHHRLAIAAVAVVLAPVVAYLIAGPGYGAFSGSVGTIIAMIGMGALYAFVVSVITRLLQLGLGSVAAVFGSLLLIFLNIPSSGGTVAAQLLPGFWRFLNQFWIGAAGLDANRSVLYFGGTGVGTDVLKMVGWVVASAVVLALPIYRRAKRCRQTQSPTPEVTPNGLA
jgi:hypothetical protein